MWDKLKKFLSDQRGAAAGEETSSFESEYEAALRDAKPDKLLILRLVLAALLFLLGIFSKLGSVGILIFMLAAALMASYDMILSVCFGIIERKRFDERLVILLAGILSFCVGAFAEGAAVIILYQIGILVRSLVVRKARQAVLEEIDKRPVRVSKLISGREAATDPGELKAGDHIVLHPGERVCVDCIVYEGSSTLDLSELTGDPLPRAANLNDCIPAGAVNLSSVLRARVLVPADVSTAARVLNAVSAQRQEKSSTERIVEKIAQIYMPAAVALGVLAAILLSIFTELSVVDGIRRGLVLFAVASPGAMVLSVALTAFAGTAGAAGKGVIFRSRTSMEDLAGVSAVIFDKTGTLTTGRFKVTAVKSDRMDATTMLKIAAHAEANSSHPIARGICAAYKGEIHPELVSKFEEHPGRGVTGEVGGMQIVLGNAEFFAELALEVDRDGTEEAGAVIYMAIAGQYAGRILLADMVQENAAKTVETLTDIVGKDIIMLTGDSGRVSARLAERLGIREFYANCRLEDKAERMKDIRARLGGKKKLAYVSDGLSEKTLLDSADIGVAMNGLAAAVSFDAADVVVMSGDSYKIVTAIMAARSTRSIIWQNILFILAAKVLLMVLGLLGVTYLWSAILADLIISIVVCLSVLRACSVKTVPTMDFKTGKLRGR